MVIIFVQVIGVGVNILQISSATFLQPGTWAVTVMSTAAIGQLESTYNNSQRICFISQLIHVVVTPHLHLHRRSAGGSNSPPTLTQMISRG